MKKLYQFLPALVFLAFLAVMTLLLLFGPHRDYSEREKDYLAGAPEVSLSGFLDGSLQKGLEEFTTDQIPGRDFFVGVNAYWKLCTGQNAAQDIYHCREGYLINAPKQTDGTVFAANLARFDAFAESTGLPAELMIVPTTGYLMEELLPVGHGAYHEDECFQTAQDTLQYIRLLDVRQTLRESLSEGQVCYRTDHHLTSFGSYLLSRAFLTEKGLPCRDRSDYQVTAYEGFFGTTWSGSGYWLTEPDTLETWDSGAKVSVTFQDSADSTVTKDTLFYPEHQTELDKYPIFLDGNHSLVTIENPSAPERSILLIRDSYAHCFAPFLAEQYRTVYLIDLRYYRASVSEFLASHPVDSLLFLYGMDDMLTDTNSAWLK